MSSRRSSILLMAEIPNNHLGWCWNPINNGIAETHHLTVNNGSTWISQAMPKAVSRHLEATREVWIGCDCGKQSWSTNSIMLLLWYYVYIQLIKWLLLYIILLLRSIIYYYYHYYYYLPYISRTNIYIYMVIHPYIVQSIMYCSIDIRLVSMSTSLHAYAWRSTMSNQVPNDAILLCGMAKILKLWAYFEAKTKLL